MDDRVFDLSSSPVHLGLGGRVVRLDGFDGTPQWYERYSDATEGDGVDGRLVSLHTFDGPWDSWEMHPVGDELVVCAAGSMVLHQEIGAEVRTVELHEGQAVVNPPGVWHTADVSGSCTAWFVTAGRGTEVRPR